MLWIILFAQNTDAISGGSGWAGAGLLGLVLSWVFLVHLPSKDKQIKEIMADARMEMAQQRADFKVSLDRITEHCEEEMKQVSSTFYQAVKDLREAVIGRRQG